MAMFRTHKKPAKVRKTSTGLGLGVGTPREIHSTNAVPEVQGMDRAN